MGRRNETGFELRWREINTAFQTSVEKLREPSWIAPFCPGKIDNRRARKKQTEHRAEAVKCDVDLCVRDRLACELFEVRAEFFEQLPAVDPLELM